MRRSSGVSAGGGAAGGRRRRRREDEEEEQRDQDNHARAANGGNDADESDGILYPRCDPRCDPRYDPRYDRSNDGEERDDDDIHELDADSAGNDADGSEGLEGSSKARDDDIEDPCNSHRDDGQPPMPNASRQFRQPRSAYKKTRTRVPSSRSRWKGAKRPGPRSFPEDDGVNAVSSPPIEGDDEDGEGDDTLPPTRPQVGDDTEILTPGGSTVRGVCGVFTAPGDSEGARIPGAFHSGPTYWNPQYTSDQATTTETEVATVTPQGPPIAEVVPPETNPHPNTASVSCRCSTACSGTCSMQNMGQLLWVRIAIAIALIVAVVVPTCLLLWGSPDDGSTSTTAGFTATPTSANGEDNPRTFHSVHPSPFPSMVPAPLLYGENQADEWTSSQDDWILHSTRISSGSEAHVKAEIFLELSKDGKTIAVGMKYESPPGSNQRWIRVYQFDGTLREMKSLAWSPANIWKDVEDYTFGGGLALSRNASRMALGMVSWHNSPSETKGFVPVLEQQQGDAFVGPSWKLLGSASIPRVGTSIAMSLDGSIVAITTPSNLDPSLDTNVVSIFRLSEDQTEWIQMGLNLTGGTPGAQFGADLCLALDGLDRWILAVGAPGDSKVFLFMWSKNEDIWELLDDIMGESPSDQFGFSIALSADARILAVGAPSHNNHHGQVQFWELSLQNGHYKLFDKEGTTHLEGEHEDDLFGSSLCLSDDGMTCMVGAPRRKTELDGMLMEGKSGRVLAFENHDPCRSWVQKTQQTHASLSGHHDRNLGLSGDGKVFIAITHFGDHVKDYGEIRLFSKIDHDDWEPVGQTLMGSASGDRYGSEVSVGIRNGTPILAAGAGWAAPNNVLDAGYADVLQLDDSHWVEEHRFVGHVKHALLSVGGLELSNDGSTLAFGVKGGEVRVFSFDGGAESNWTLMDKLQIPMEEDLESVSKVGTSIALSDQGLVLVVGTWSSINDWGNQTGLLTVYSRDTTSSTKWSVMGSPIPGHRGADDGLGSSVAISGDGKTVAAAYGVSREYSLVFGSVRVYRYEASGWVQVGQDLEGFSMELPYSPLRISLNHNGTMVAVGSHIFEIGDFHGNGTVSVFQLSNNDTNSTWEPVGDSIPGGSVDLRDTVDGRLLIAIGSAFHEYQESSLCSNRGMVQVFEWKNSSGSWQQIGGDIVGEEKLDTIGTSVALSPDGRMLVVGGEHSSHRGHWQSGIVWVFVLVSPNGGEE